MNTPLYTYTGTYAEKEAVRKFRQKCSDCDRYHMNTCSGAIAKRCTEQSIEQLKNNLKKIQT